ncbi:hypothetical protein HMPREF0653_01978 [Prevotella disiens JCM 6334 = ATCC 29426]|uniref:Uncharacterized protein n=1 Tax=Prevotella disiens JCM 6334 = ATCC 29426 TaxID=1235811 RepID=A0ABN0NQI5_9BACT|nr:hypothetical protein HMPREF0653_01978 [Prevotella disiens JCM 6334 = ATCC 29426]
MSHKGTEKSPKIRINQPFKSLSFCIIYLCQGFAIWSWQVKH